MRAVRPRLVYCVDAGIYCVDVGGNSTILKDGELYTAIASEEESGIPSGLDKEFILVEVAERPGVRFYKRRFSEVEVL